MSSTLKKRFAAIAAAFLLAVICITTVGGLKTDKADALATDYSGAEVYYFSDSEPTFNYLSYFATFYDMHKFISEEEFEFMVYGGYFWGFKHDNERAVVVIQLATIKPSYQALNDLFECLNYQKCKVVFLTPYTSYYGGLPCESIIPCPFDNYNVYLIDSVLSMYAGLEISDFLGDSDSDDEVHDNRPPHNGGSIPLYTVLFLDGRIVGISDYYMDLDIRLEYMYVRAFRRLLGYMRYGFSNSNPCEYDIYNYLWNVYCDTVLEDDDYYDNFGNQPNMGEYISKWTDMDESGKSSILYDFWHAYDLGYYDERYQAVYGDFYEEYKYIIGEYYNSSFIDYFSARNTHIYAHADGCTYYSLFELEYSDISGETYKSVDYSFYEYSDFLHIQQKPIYYIYAMGISRLKYDFYSFLYEFQSYIANPDNLEALDYDEIYSRGVTVFVWIDEPLINDPNGLKVITSEQLKEYYGQYDEYDYDEWWAIMIDLLRQLINSLWVD